MLFLLGGGNLGFAAVLKVVKEEISSKKANVSFLYALTPVCSAQAE
jgi:hypothetical protein